MQQGGGEKGSQIGRTVRTITIITWHFQFNPVNASNLHVKSYTCSTWEPFHALLPLFRHVMPVIDGNCRLTIPDVKGRCARERVPDAFDIGVFKYYKNNPTIIKHIYNESGNLNDSCDVVFDSNNLWCTLIGIDSMVTRAGLRYTRDCLTPKSAQSCGNIE